jgi:hypothetical protein
MNNTIKRLIPLLIICAGIFMSCGSTPSSPEGETVRRQNIYMDFLKKEGYVPTIDEDGDIMFKREGYTFFIIIGKSDPSFLSLLKPNIWSIKSDADRTRAANAVCYVNGEMKVAKAYISGSKDEWVSLAVEIYLDDPHHFSVLLSRMLRLIDGATEEFADKI